MSLAGDGGKKDAVDLQLKKFIEVVSANQRFQGLVHELTDICWETCVDKPTLRLEAKTKNCIVNCVGRFIDTTNFITNRLQQVTAARDWE